MKKESPKVLVRRKGKYVAIDLAVHRYNLRKKRERKQNAVSTRRKSSPSLEA